MTNEEKLLIDFYKNGGALKVLNRYEFSDKERKIINRAILSAKRSRPNLTLIKEADAMLQEAINTRAPLSNDIELNNNRPPFLKPSFFARYKLSFLGKIIFSLFLASIISLIITLSIGNRDVFGLNSNSVLLFLSFVFLMVLMNRN